MKRRLSISRATQFLMMGTIGLATLLGIWFAATRSNEPKYKGKTVGEWLDAPESSWNTLPLDPDTGDMLEQLGTNAIPPLMNALRDDSTFWSRMTIPVARSKQAPWSVRNFAAGKWLHKMRHIERAGVALQVLGPRVSETVPALERLLCEPRSELSWIFASMVLSKAGPKGLQALERSLTNSPIARLPAIQSGIDSARAELVHHPLTNSSSKN